MASDVTEDFPDEDYGGLVTDDQVRSVKPWDLLKSDNYTTADVRNERLNICMECPRLAKLPKVCKECGCFMGAKTWLKEAFCPIDKWGAVHA